MIGRMPAAIFSEIKKRKLSSAPANSHDVDMFRGWQDGKLPLDEALAEGLRDSVDILMTSMGAGPVRWDAHESVLHAVARVGSPALCSMIVAW